MIGDYLILAPMIFAAGLLLGSRAANRPRARLAEIKALMLKQDRLRDNNTQCGRSDCYGDLWDLVAPAEDE